MIVRAFDGTRRETLGEIKLPIEIGSITFAISFQVLEVTLAYDLLLGRPWIHVAGSVPSSLHQRIKFVINDSVITVHAEEDAAIYDVSAIPLANFAVAPSSYQTLESVPATSETPVSPKYSSNAKMIAACFHRQGFRTDKGLGAKLQERAEPVRLPGQTHTVGDKIFSRRTPS